MFSLCRLCAEYKNSDELKTEIIELESKLTLCCDWNASSNVSEMPPKACDSCVGQLEKSWCFAKSVKAAEKKLSKLISEQNRKESTDDEVITNDDAILSNSFEVKPDICNVEINELEINEENDIFDDPDDPTTYSNVDSEVSSENELIKITKKTTDEKKSLDPFLAQLTDEDRLGDGAISVNGVAKLEQLFPEMKSMSWTECEYKCDKCNRIFKGPHKFYAHNRSLHFDNIHSVTFKCVYCKSRHGREYTLSRHIAAKHFPHLKFRCWYCSDYFWDHRELAKHRNMHSNIEYACELCDQVCMSRDLLYSHVLQSHQKKRSISDPDPETKFTCDICSKTYVTKWGIKSHMLQHIKKYDYVCDQCGWKFLTKGNLKGHLQTTHSDEKNVICEQCNARFKTKYQLKAHAKRHEEFKPFACKDCDKRFRQAYGLKVHMRCHSNTFMYSCKYCDRKFRHNSSFKTHVLTHTADKPYRCTVCEYRSTNWPNLNKHSLRIHSIDLRIKKT